MKLEIYKLQEEEEEEEEEQVVRVKLKKMYDGTISLIVVDSLGMPRPRGNLLRITSNGIYRHKGVSLSFGFPLDDRGRIKLDEG